MRLTYDAILNDPSLLERIERQAHRERARMAHELIVLPIARFFTDGAPHLAHQGSRPRVAACLE